MKDIYRYADLIKLGYGCRSTIYSMINEGKFPQPMDINGRPGWYGEDLQEWKDSMPKYIAKLPEHLKSYVQPNAVTA